MLQKSIKINAQGAKLRDRFPETKNGNIKLERGSKKN